MSIKCCSHHKETQVIDGNFWCGKVNKRYSSVFGTLNAVVVETIDIFCKNVFNLRSVSTRTYAEERVEPAADTLMNAVEDPFEDPKQVLLIT